MKLNKKLTGLAVASAAALAFATVPVGSALAGSNSNQNGASIKCMGANACKGQSACATAKNQCKGQNSCKGMGFVMVKDKAACDELGGTTEDETSGS